MTDDETPSRTAREVLVRTQAGSQSALLATMRQNKQAWASNGIRIIAES